MKEHFVIIVIMFLY